MYWDYVPFVLNLFGVKTMNHIDIVKCTEDGLVQMIKDTFSSDCVFEDISVVESTNIKWVVRVVIQGMSTPIMVFVSQFTQSYYRIER